jgi:hypothetical protein
MAIHLHLTIDDPDVQAILTFVENKFSDEWVEERVRLLEQAAHLLKVGAEYREANSNPRRLAGLAFVDDPPSQAHDAPTDKRPLHSSHLASFPAACKS